MSSAFSTSTPKVNLLDLAAACVACTEAASRAIQQIAEPPPDTASAKNTRSKADGSCVTDADYAAQGIIVQAIRAISPHVRIMGEESADEMAVHMGRFDGSSDRVYQRSRSELVRRWWYQQNGSTTTASSSTQQHTLPLSMGLVPSETDIVDDALEDERVVVDASRVGVIVDPLDGTKAYANGDYDAVSILIAITLDHEPYFGVIGKPFGYQLEGADVTSMLDTKCVVVYGGPLLRGVYVAGGRTIQAPLSDPTRRPRAVISSSRSTGVVQDFCAHLAHHQLVHTDPLLIAGAGEKSLRLILHVHDEALWFFPKAGTSLWDVAAPDALLRALGGKLTDKWGRALDYSKSRDEAENIDGVVACNNADLHAQCLALFQGDWLTRI